MEPPRLELAVGFRVSPSPSTRCIIMHIIQHQNNHNIPSFMLQPYIDTPWIISSLSISSIPHLVGGINS
jgi:hypothetical protein